VSRWRARAVRLVEWLRRDRVDADTDAEIQAHVDHLTDEFVRRGLDRDAARRAALLEFGGVERAREAVRDRRGLRPLDTLVRDVRHAARLLAATPAFSAAAILTLAIGIGANAAIFSLVDGVLLRPLPYHDPAALVAVRELLPPSASEPGADRRIVVAPANLADYRKARAASGLAGYMPVTRSFSGAATPERLVGEAVTPEYFAVLGVAPLHGRTLQSSDAASDARVVVVSHAFWRERFGGRADAIGATLRLDDEAFEIAGVMPATFQGVSQARGSAPVIFWQPLAFPPDVLANRKDHEVAVVARLAPGATVEQLASELGATAAGFGPDAGGIGVTVDGLREDIARDVKPLLLLLLAAVGLVLLLACVNVASLLIVRSIGRRREIAIRLALGATRLRIAAQLLTQSVVLAGCGAMAGLALAVLLKRSLLAVTPADIPRLDAVAMDGRVLLFTIAITAVTAVVFGILPAIQVTRSGPRDALATTGRVVAGTWASRARTGLMIAEIALSTVLLIGAALMIRSLTALNAVPLGFDASGVLTAIVRLPDSRYATPVARLQFFDAAAQSLARLPGAEAVAFGNRLPLRGGWTSGFLLEPEGGLPGAADASAGFQSVSPEYFDLYRIRLLRGRSIAPADRDGAPAVALVNEEFARQFLGGGDPIGRRLRRGPKAPSIEIVGVVSDIRRYSRTMPIDPEVYLPAAQTSLYPLRLEQVAVRFSGDALARANELRAAIWSVDPDQPVASVSTLDEVLALQQGTRRFQTFLFNVFAALALVLAVVGIYGVVAYAVGQRRPEIALRMALGASGTAVLRWLLTHWLGIVSVGAAGGIVAALLLGRLVQGLLFEISPADPLAFVAATTVFGVAALAACFVAVRAATKIDPASVLK
jgi:predicted permease